MGQRMAEVDLITLELVQEYLVSTVREMRATHTFFLPTLNGTPFTHKPPIHFWMIDLLTFPLGVYSTWAFVLPSLIAFIFLIWLMWRVGGPLAAFICGSSLMIWASAQSARMDVSFTAFIVLAVWQLERFFDRDDFRALLWSAIALGIAVLIKGPMAPVIAIEIAFSHRAGRPRSDVTYSAISSATGGIMAIM